MKRDDIDGVQRKLDVILGTDVHGDRDPGLDEVFRLAKLALEAGEVVRRAWRDGWEHGHSAGISCGHPMSPMCDDSDHAEGIEDRAAAFLARLEGASGG